jgi:large subunit ribosomal protein L25
MKKTLLLEAEVRTHAGSKDAARLRRQGRIPAVVYGHKQEAQAVSVDAHAFVEGLHHGHRLIDLKVGSNTESTIVKDLQYDFLGRDIIHVDLVRVDVTERIKVAVPLELKGTPKGAHEGGILEEHADRLDIECLVTNIPEAISVSVKEIGVGDVLHAGDVAIPEGIKLVSPASTLLVTCHLKAAVVSEEELEEEAPSAPEVISEKKAEEASDEA